MSTICSRAVLTGETTRWIIKRRVARPYTSMLIIPETVIDIFYHEPHKSGRGVKRNPYTTDKPHEK